MDPGVQIAAIVVLAVGGNWIAARLRVPSILLLLVIGLTIGPGMGWVDPDGLLGPLLAPAVSLAVGVILFEGGLSLRISEVKGRQRVIWSLVSVGVVVTWIVGSLAALAFTNLSTAGAILVGAILVVSGPTVIQPILQSVRPDRTVSSLLKWESIFVDPIGALLAVITFDIILQSAEAGSRNPGMVAGQVAVFVVAGLVIGAATAALIIIALRLHLVPYHLLPLVGLAGALVAFSASNAFAHESGLLATTVLGLALSNHRRVRTEQILHFSEVIRILLIGVLFILLSARLTRDEITALGPGVLGLIAALVLIARPLAVYLSTLGAGLDRNVRLFLAGVAPRGIVAASIASVFALELEEVGVEGIEGLTAVTFAVIVACVLLYGLGAGPLARRLGLATAQQEGVLILGAGSVERALGEALGDAGFEVIVATTNRRDDYSARMAGLRTFYGNVLDEEIDLALDLSGVGRLLALTPNDEVNTLAAQRFAEIFGGNNTYQLDAAAGPPGVEGSVVDLGGRVLFAEALDHDALEKTLAEGRIRRTKISDDAPLRSQLGDEDVVLFVVRGRRLLVGTADPVRPLADQVQNGDLVIWLERAV